MHQKSIMGVMTESIVDWAKPTLREHFKKVSITVNGVTVHGYATNNGASLSVKLSLSYLDVSMQVQVTASNLFRPLDDIIVKAFETVEAEIGKRLESKLAEVPVGSVVPMNIVDRVKHFINAFHPNNSDYQNLDEGIVYSRISTKTFILEKRNDDYVRVGQKSLVYSRYLLATKLVGQSKKRE